MTGVPLQASGHLTLRVSASMMTLVFVALVLRAFSKLQTRGGFLFEDILIILAAALFYTDQGLFLQFRSFLLVNWIVFGTCIIWGIITTFLLIFQCNPIRGMWVYELQATGKATCMSSSELIFGFEISNVVIDVLILSLPIYMIQRLQLRTAKKVSIIAIFVMGGFVCITCAVRAYYVFDPKTKMSRSLPLLMVWTTIEVTFAIVCACLPTYGPLFSQLVIPSSLKTWYASLISTFRTSQPSKVSEQYDGSLSTKSNNSQYDQLVDGTKTSHFAKVVGGPYGRSSETQSHYGSDYQMNNIRVQRSVEVV
ncbi:MAG: hypothetical protein M1818_003871 [Claussenomyces sp. TS43310]|nr:MAG: hypothetical protein M1818_003871 [Claussenomyces sp. TS43310]